MIFTKDVIRVGNLVFSRAKHLPDFSMRNGFKKYIKIGKWFIFFQRKIKF